MEKHELVKLDERFIEWIANPDFSISECNKDYLIVISCDGDSAVDCHGVDMLDGVKQYITEMIENPEGWSIEAIFDLANRKELKYNSKVKVNITFK